MRVIINNIRLVIITVPKSIHFNEFELPGGISSVSYIKGYMEYIIKNIKHDQVILLFIFASTGLIID